MNQPVAVYDFDGNMNDSLGFGAVLGNINGYEPGKLGDSTPYGVFGNDGPHKFDFLLSPAGGAVCLWYKVDANAVSQGENMLQFLQEDSIKSLSLEIGSNGTHVLVEAGYGMPGAGRVSRVAPLTPGWHHFAWAWANGVMTIYVDGLQQGSPESFELFTTAGLVGLSEQLGINYGNADQLCIFNGPASQAKFQQIYNAGEGRPHTEFTGPDPGSEQSLTLNTTNLVRVVTTNGDIVTFNGAQSIHWG